MVFTVFDNRPQRSDEEASRTLNPCYEGYSFGIRVTKTYGFKYRQAPI